MIARCDTDLQPFLSDFCSLYGCDETSSYILPDCTINVAHKRDLHHHLYGWVE